jgi:beta-lactamase superfamily II metal-dependent hydrolase
MRRNIKISISLILIVVLLLAFTGCGPIETDASTGSGLGTNDTKLERTTLEVHFIDVGQADSILIKVPTGENMLIDAGNNGDSELLDKYLKAQGIEKIDVAVGTHPHEDHIGSLDTVINNFDVKKVYMPKYAHTTKTFEDVLLAIKNKGLKISTPIPGDTFNLGEAKFSILAPNGDNYKSINDYSIVLRMEYGNNSFLFTGDSEDLSEKEILEKKYNVQADVLKVAHHGSTTSTSDEFLNAVSPEFAVISCGEGNDYGHPHKEIVSKLNKKGIKILRTDELGTIVINSDGENLTLENGKVSQVPDKSEANIGIEIIDIDKKGELVTIKNTSSSTINLKGWKLISLKGNQQFIFPEYNLASGGILTVSSGDLEGDLEWGSINIWNNTESDPGELYDNNGNLVFTYDD